MTRLTAYLVRLFSADAIALLAIVAFLLFLVQTLRSFDLVTVKGQDLLTLVSQTLLSMPTIVTAFAYVCIGIGLARGLRALRLSQELQVIHASRCAHSLFSAIAIYTLAGTCLVLAMTNFIDPISKRHFNSRQADIAADLVSRTLTPGRFIEMTPGVTILIGSRGESGEIGDFFADDRRVEGARRTFIARSATFAVDERGFVIRMRDGAIQNMADNKRYSEIAFATYDLAIDRLSGGRTGAPSGADEMTTADLVSRSLAGDTPGSLARELSERFSEGLRVIALCLMVTAIAAFPTGNRTGGWLPLEVVIIFAAFGERLISDLPQLAMPFVSTSGAVIIGALSLGVVLLRLRRLPAPRLRPAT